MTMKREDPAALAGANRVEATKLRSKNDLGESTSTPLDLQVRKILATAPVSRSLAVIIAVLAFSQGRRS